MDITKAIGPILGPKRKAHMYETQGGVFIDKKQRLLDEETKILGKLMADNLGSTIAALQHRREQWVSWVGTVGGLGTSKQLTHLRESWIKKLPSVSS